MWVGLIQSAEGLNRIKRPAFLKKNYLADCLHLNHWFSWFSRLPVFHTGTATSTLLNVESVTYTTDLDFPVSIIMGLNYL